MLESVAAEAVIQEASLRSRYMQVIPVVYLGSQSYKTIVEETRSLLSKHLKTAKKEQRAIAQIPGSVNWVGLLNS